MQCNVCLENFDLEEHEPQTLICGHSFCSTCMVQLARRGRICCPTCRVDSCPSTVKVNFEVRAIVVEALGLPSPVGVDRLRGASLHNWDSSPEPLSVTDVGVGLTCMFFGAWAASFGFCWALPGNDRDKFLQQARKSLATFSMLSPLLTAFGLTVIFPVGGLLGFAAAPVVWPPFWKFLLWRPRSDKVAIAFVALGGASWPLFVWQRSHWWLESLEIKAMKSMFAVLQAFIVGAATGLCHVAVEGLPEGHILLRAHHALIGDRTSIASMSYFQHQMQKLWSS